MREPGRALLAAGWLAAAGCGSGSGEDPLCPLADPACGDAAPVEAWVDFGAVPVGETGLRHLLLQLDDRLSLERPRPPFSMTPCCDQKPGEAATIDVSFQPAAEGEFGEVVVGQVGDRAFHLYLRGIATVTSP